MRACGLYSFSTQQCLSEHDSIKTHNFTRLPSFSIQFNNEFDISSRCQYNYLLL